MVSIGEIRTVSPRGPTEDIVFVSNVLSITGRLNKVNTVFTEIIRFNPEEVISREEESLAALALSESYADHDQIVEELI